MKILHMMLSCFYIDNYGYQENILPKMHQLQGHEVMILASTETYIGNKKLGYVEPSFYFTGSGIPIKRIPYKKFLPRLFMRKLRVYSGIEETLIKFKPDIIFMHDCQFVSISDVVSYVKKFPKTKIYVDGHTDFNNSARNWISRYFLHGVVYKWCAKKIEPHTRKFYGVLPARVEFFKSMYGISEDKVELLVMGVDDSIIDFSKKTEIRARIRVELNIDENDFVIISGGKVDRRKNIHFLMRAVNELNLPKLKLIIFGAPNDDIKNEFEKQLNSTNIRFAGWLQPEMTNEFILASDLGFFPGTHSVLWEQTVGMGVPCVFKRWKGIEHIDLGGNCMFINNGNVDEIKEAITSIYTDSNLYKKMLMISNEKGIKKFSYYQIAKNAIEE